MRADRDPKIVELRKHKGTKYIACLDDGSKRELVLSDTANRWEKLQQLLATLPWVTIEVQNKEGATMGIVESDVEYDDGDDDRSMAQVERMAKIIAGAYANAMIEVRRVVETNAGIIGKLQDAVTALADTYSLALQVQRTNLMSAGATPGEDDKVWEMMKMAMMLKGGGTPAITVKPASPSKNGANGKAT